MIPIAFPNKRFLSNPIKVLAADIGGTKTNVALFEASGESINLIDNKKFPSKHYNSFSDIIKEFCGDPRIVNSMCVGIAGPVIEGKAQATNLEWSMDVNEIKAELGIPNVRLLNDLEINAYGLAALKTEECVSLASGIAPFDGNVALISPGTGLGEAGLFWDGQHYHPFATEGGHSDFCPRSEIDIDIFNYLLGKFKRVSWERLVSGQGIYNIFQFLRDVKNEFVPDWLNENIQNGDPGKAISEGRIQNVPICISSIDLFIKFLAIESANLALKLKATGGIFIGGGIVPKIIDEVKRSDFFDHFVAAGRLQPLMQEIPINIILNDHTALLGAAYYAAYS